MAKVNLNSPLTMEEAFESFLFSKSAQGLTDKTLKSYKSHFKCISKYLDTTIKLNSLKKETIYKMIAEMRQTDLSPNTIASYIPETETEYTAYQGFCALGFIPSFYTKDEEIEACGPNELIVGRVSTVTKKLQSLGVTVRDA